MNQDNPLIKPAISFFKAVNSTYLTQKNYNDLVKKGQKVALAVENVERPELLEINDEDFDKVMKSIPKTFRSNMIAAGILNILTSCHAAGFGYDESDAV